MHVRTGQRRGGQRKEADVALASIDCTSLFVVPTCPPAATFFHPALMF
jgi:hypothetical protein